MLIERYGTVIKRVRRMFTDYGLLEPHFETIPGGFAVTVFGNTDSDLNSNTNAVNEPVNEPVNERQKKITSLISQDKTISINDLSNTCKVGRETIKRDLNKLKDLNFIKRVGSDKTGYWELVNS